MKTPPEPQPFCTGYYKCGCSRLARLNELPQLCPVHREVQTSVASLLTPGDNHE